MKMINRNMSYNDNLRLLHHTLYFNLECEMRQRVRESLQFILEEVVVNNLIDQLKNNLDTPIE